MKILEVAAMTMEVLFAIFRSLKNVIEKDLL